MPRCNGSTPSTPRTEPIMETCGDPVQLQARIISRRPALCTALRASTKPRPIKHVEAIVRKVVLRAGSTLPRLLSRTSGLGQLLVRRMTNLQINHSPLPQLRHSQHNLSPLEYNSSTSVAGDLLGIVSRSSFALVTSYNSV